MYHFLNVHDVNVQAIYVCDIPSLRLCEYLFRHKEELFTKTSQIF